MIRGLSYKIPNGYGHVLYKMLKGIDVESYLWRITEEQTIDGNNYLFGCELMEGSDFARVITTSDYYIIFLNLQAYPNGVSIGDIRTYEAFQKSNCILNILITDVIHVDVYCKNQNIIECMNQNAIYEGFGEKGFITDKNDQRTDLIAF